MGIQKLIFFAVGQLIHAVELTLRVYQIKVPVDEQPLLKLLLEHLEHFSLLRMRLGAQEAQNGKLIHIRA